MKIAIIINSKKITPELSEKLHNPDLATKYNLSYDLFVKNPEEIESFLKTLNHQSYSGYVIGGGDGTVRTAAQVLFDQDVSIAILPLGTFNFLAKTLDYPNDIEMIFSIIKNNKTKLIDLGEVNNIIFINHAWIGFYYYILKLRQKHSALLGNNKLLRILFNAFNFFNVLPTYDLEFKVDNEKVKSKACLVYIGNNDQYTNILDFGDRKSISSGLLSVYILNCKTRWQLVKCIWDLVSNNFKKSKYITQFTTDNLTINSKYNVINSVIDGELFKLETPLNYTIQKKKLSVFIP